MHEPLSIPTGKAIGVNLLKLLDSHVNDFSDLPLVFLIGCQTVQDLSPLAPLVLLLENENQRLHKDVVREVYAPCEVLFLLFLGKVSVLENDLLPGK